MTGSRDFRPRYYSPPSFFEHLNYDVRQIIYQFMGHDLPPVGHCSHFSGFALSCKQAHEELRQPAIKSLKGFLDEFQKDLQIYTATNINIVPEISMRSSIKHLQNITIKVPAALVISSFDIQLEKTIVALRPLLSGYFQKVTFLFTDPNHEYPPSFRTAMRVSSGFALFRLAQIIVDERRMQSSIKALSKYARLLTAYHDAHPTTGIQAYPHDFASADFLHNGPNLPYPINTSHIQIAWDWRDETQIGKSAMLRGYHHDHEKQREPTWPRLMVAESKDKLVGQQSIICKNKWSVPESVKIYWLLQEQRYKTMRGYCWAEGPGKDFEQGLNGITEQEFRNIYPPLVLAAFV